MDTFPSSVRTATRSSLSRRPSSEISSATVPRELQPVKMAVAASAEKKKKRVFIQRIDLVFSCKNEAFKGLYKGFSRPMYGVKTGCMRASARAHFVLYFWISYNGVS